jgi:molecular chaperone GrpE
MTVEEQPAPPPSPEGGAREVREGQHETLLREELEEALRESAQFRAMAQRAQADLINYKRRSAEEMDELKNAANFGLLLKVVSIADDLDRALSLIPRDAVAPGWLEGLELAQRNIDVALGLEGVTKIEALGKPFDPWEFEAVQHQETPDTQEGHVIKVLREGYRRRDRVLRAAQVIVAKKPESDHHN